MESRLKLKLNYSELLFVSQHSQQRLFENRVISIILLEAAYPSCNVFLICFLLDCALETVVKYGYTYHIPINPSIGPYRLEFRSGAHTHVNQTTEEPPVLLLNRTSIPTQEYERRLNVDEKRVNLHLVTGADEGSYTVVDSDEKVRLRACLNVKGKINQCLCTLYEVTVSVSDKRQSLT